MTPIQRADHIIEWLKAFIERNKLDVLKQYPNDLLVHDRRQLEKLAMPGMRFGWKADHSSTHIITIGVHLKEMKLISTLVNLTSASKYLEIFIPYAGPVEYTEHTAESFAKLESNEVPFRSAGNLTDFTVYRGSQKLGRIVITDKGYLDGSTTKTFAARIHPDEFGSVKDQPVLQLWAEHGVTAAAQTFFVNSDIQVTHARNV